MSRLFYHALPVALAVLLSGGCVSVQRATPAAFGQVNVKLRNNDYKLLASVKGTSSTKSYACGIVKVIDGEKFRVLGVKFFNDQFCYLTPKDRLSDTEKLMLFYPGFWVFLPVTAPYIVYTHSASAEDRAYYKVLAAVPDADEVINPALVAQRSGVPLICREEVVTLTAKAIKYKAD